MQLTCALTGKPFEVTPEEIAMRRKLGVDGNPTLHPVTRWMQLAGFWQHWNLYKRACDRTGKSIISVFSADCPYPVWHKDEWVAHADPPGADFDPSTPVFPQLWNFFSKSPIAHNIGTANENCEYADDWWYSKNCYLCHSGYEDEDLRYCYRIAGSKNCMFCVFTFSSELCIDLINCHNCFKTFFAYNCWHCSDSAFLYDCRNCSNCFLCHNLRNKQYCIENKQLTKEEYETQMRGRNFRSRKDYQRATADFFQMLEGTAWHRALFIDKSESSTGNYLDECKGVVNSYFLSTGEEDCVNCMRAGKNNKDCLDSISTFESQLIYCSALAQDKCYDVKFGYNVIQCKDMEYSAHCFQCEHCFGCCGLRGKKYHVFNKPYASAEYETLKKKIVAHMKTTGEYGSFFPGHFAAHPYDESLAGFYWPLNDVEAKRFGFRLSSHDSSAPIGALASDAVPDSSDGEPGELTKQVFWDDEAKRPFQVQAADIANASALGVPLPWCYYAKRLQENFRLIPFDGTLRSSVCGKCKAAMETSWPKEYDGRILCEKCYLETVY